MNRTRSLAPVLGLAVLASGCKPPPEAPAKLEQLCDYIFAHADDEDPTELIAGVENLDKWLSKGDNLALTTEGYTIDTLQKSSVGDLGIRNPRIDRLVGAAVAVKHNASLKRVAKTTAVDEWGDVAYNDYKEYRRNYDRNPGCFPKKNCEEMSATAYSESSWAGLIDVVSRNKIQFRWVFSENNEKWYLVHRSWLTEPATVTPDSFDINVYAQYFLGTTMPINGKSVRLMSTWIDADYGPIPISDDGVKGQIVNSMVKQGEYVDEWHAN